MQPRKCKPRKLRAARRLEWLFLGTAPEASLLIASHHIIINHQCIPPTQFQQSLLDTQTITQKYPVRWNHSIYHLHYGKDRDRRGHIANRIRDLLSGRSSGDQFGRHPPLAPLPPPPHNAGVLDGADFLCDRTASKYYPSGADRSCIHRKRPRCWKQGHLAT
jgi:hypothetical protein